MIDSLYRQLFESEDPEAEKCENSFFGLQNKFRKVLLFTMMEIN